MKEYNKPIIQLLKYELDDILLISTSDEMLDYEGDFEEIW